MAIVRTINLTDDVYQALSNIKGDLSYSKTIEKLIQEHSELVKIKLEIERTAPC